MLWKLIVTQLLLSVTNSDAFESVAYKAKGNKETKPTENKTAPNDVKDKTKHEAQNNKAVLDKDKKTGSELKVIFLIPSTYLTYFLSLIIYRQKPN